MDIPQVLHNVNSAADAVLSLVCPAPICYLPSANILMDLMTVCLFGDEHRPQIDLSKMRSNNLTRVGETGDTLREARDEQVQLA